MKVAKRAGQIALRAGLDDERIEDIGFDGSAKVFSARQSQRRILGLLQNDHRGLPMRASARMGYLSIFKISLTTF
jgi:hypothetical protein